MSLKHEQYRALLQSRDLLRDILTKPQRLMVRSVLRQRASSALKHFPLLMEDGEPVFSKDSFHKPKDWNE